MQTILRLIKDNRVWPVHDFVGHLFATVGREAMQEYDLVGRMPQEVCVNLVGRQRSEALRVFLYEPTCTISGFRSGYIEPGSKTVLPSEAMVKLDMRLVPDLTPEISLRLVRLWRHSSRMASAMRSGRCSPGRQLNWLPLLRH